jgi:hypothetical protein
MLNIRIIIKIIKMIIHPTGVLSPLWQQNPFTQFVIGQLDFRRLFANSPLEKLAGEHTWSIHYHATRQQILNEVSLAPSKYIYLVNLVPHEPFKPHFESSVSIHIIFDTKENLMKFLPFHDLNIAYYSLCPLYQIHADLKFNRGFMPYIFKKFPRKVKFNFLYTAPILRNQGMMKKSWLAFISSLKIVFGDTLCKAHATHPATWSLFHPDKKKAAFSPESNVCENTISVLLAKHQVKQNIK